MADSFIVRIHGILLEVIVMVSACFADSNIVVLQLQCLMVMLLHVLFILFVCRCPDGMTWKEIFASWYHDFGKYWRIYKQIRRAWDQIEAYMEKHCPYIHSTLQGFH